MKTELMAPDICIYFVDETANWSPEIVERAGGKILGVYWYNANLVVHCCELTGSYELHFIESIVVPPLPCDTIEQERERDAVEEEIRDGNRYSDGVVYYHCHDIDRVPKNKRHLKHFRYWKFSQKEWETLVEDTDSTGKDVDQALDELIYEAVSCNTPY
jgi:hypothetical protein